MPDFAERHALRVEAVAGLVAAGRAQFAHGFQLSQADSVELKTKGSLRINDGLLALNEAQAEIRALLADLTIVPINPA